MPNPNGPAQTPQVLEQTAADWMYVQIGTEKFVKLVVGGNVLAVTVCLPLDAMKALIRSGREALEFAEVQVIKPPSNLAQA